MTVGNGTAPVEPPLTAREIAELTGLSYQSVLAEIHAGHLPAKKIRRQYLITRAGYDRWLAPDPPQTRARATAAPVSRRSARGRSVAQLKAMTAAAKGEQPC
jgi:excisionase family DNA binding protein